VGCAGKHARAARGWVAASSSPIDAELALSLLHIALVTLGGFLIYALTYLVARASDAEPLRAFYIGLAIVAPLVGVVAIVIAGRLLSGKGGRIGD